MNQIIQKELKSFGVLLGFLLLFSYLNSVAQSETTANNSDASLICDSLLVELKNAHVDSTKINILNEIAWHYAPSNFKKSMQYSDSALVLARKISWKKGEAFALKNKGETLRFSGDNKNSILTFELSLRIFEELSDKRNIASLLANIGILHSLISNHFNAFEYYDRSLDVFVQLKDKSGILKLNVFLGILFQDLKDYAKALEKYNLALKYAHELQDKLNEAIIIGNIGNIYLDEDKYKIAEEQYKFALNSFEELNDFHNYSIFLGNLSNLYLKIEKFDLSLKYNQMAIDNFMKIKNEFRAAKRTGDTGRIIFRKVLAHEKFLKNSEKEKLLELSEIKFKESIKKLIQVNRNDEVLIILYDLIEFYKFIGNYEKALLNAEKAKEIGDSLRTLDVNKKIASFNTTQDLKFQEKENQVIIIKQNYEGLIYNLVLVFVIVLIFLLAIIYFQHKRNQVYVNNKIKSHK